MSVMFRRALEAHIKQLTDTLQKPGGETREADLAHIDALLKSTRDGRFKRALRNARERLEQTAPARDTEDLRRRLDALRQVFILVKENPEYTQRRRSSRTGNPVGRPRKNPA